MDNKIVNSIKSYPNGSPFVEGKQRLRKARGKGKGQALIIEEMSLRLMMKHTTTSQKDTKLQYQSMPTAQSNQIEENQQLQIT